MPLMCLIPDCGKHFSTLSNLNKHRRIIHGLSSQMREYASDLYKYRCLEGCNTSYKFNTDLRSHLLNFHDKKKFEEFSVTTFQSYKDFKTWLEKENKMLNVQYIKNTGTKKGDGDREKLYFECIRSGTSRIITSGRKRAQKSQGTSKINCNCTSQIILTRSITSDECVAKYFKHHYGHNNDLQYLRILDSDRQNIASKLIMGVPPTKIVESVRDNICSELNRSDLLCLQDVHNVKNSFKIDIMEGCYHEIDCESVHIWVEQCKSQKENPIIYYKKQGSVCPYSKLNPVDFCLIFMNNTQRDVAKKFGHNVICVDSTHGLNAYDFELTTVLVIDEFKQGFPIAFMFSNRKDTEIFKLFFQKIKDYVGVISAKTFMTDITPVFYNAWFLVMGTVRSQLYCSWHLDRAWRNNFNKIPDADMRKWVYQSLKHIQSITNVEEFNVSLIKFKNCILENDVTKEFGVYFQNNYCLNSHQWAHCYRVLSGVNTNMHLEAMHKVIKYTYLNAKKIKRLDKTLHVLVKFLRDKTVERMIKLIKGKNTSHTTLIHGNHKEAINSKYTVEVVGHNCWKLVSTKNLDRQHIVKKISDIVCCGVQCNFCNICFHGYECTCASYRVQAVLCKHIHYVCRNYDKCTSKTTIPSSTAEVQQLAEDISSGDSKEGKLKIMKDQIFSSLLEIFNNVERKEYTESQYKYIQQMLNILKSIDASTPIMTNFEQRPETLNNQPSNTKIEKQINFYSTKRKRSRNINSIGKPNENEIKIIKETINGSLVTSTNSQEDHLYL